MSEPACNLVVFGTLIENWQSHRIFERQYNVLHTSLMHVVDYLHNVVPPQYSVLDILKTLPS